MPGPLEGLVVVEASWGAPGRIAGMLMSDYGATVVAVRRPGGEPVDLLNHRAWDRGKRLVELDLGTDEGRAGLAELLDRADVFVDGLGVRRARAWQLTPDDVARRHPALVHAAVTGYGQSGPWAERPGWDGLVAAKLGAMLEQAGPREGPKFLGHPSIAYTTAFLTVIGSLAALQARRSTQRGQTLDVSLLDGVMAMSPMNWWFNEAGASYLATNANETGFGRKRIITEMFTCADGEYLMMHTGGTGGFKLTMDLLGLGEGVRRVPEPEMGHPLDDHEYHLARVVAPEVFKTKPRAEWIDIFQSNDLAVLPVLRPGEVLVDDQVEHAGVVVALPDADHGTLRQAGPCIAYDASPPAAPAPRTTVPEPLTGVMSSLGAPRPVADAQPTTAAPLAGIRILDFSNYFATAYGAKLLSDLGADVIKVEAMGGDPMRPLPNPFEACQRGKRSIVLDLKHPEAVEAVLDLVRTADVVMHNFRPGKAEKLGIGYAQLAAVKPDLVYCYLPGFGSTGPKSAHKSFAPLLSGFTGPLYEAAGEGNPPVRRTIGNEDYNNGFVGAVAVLMGLEHRSRTGQGQRLENPQLHSSLFVQTHQMLDPDGRTVTGLQLDADQMGWGPTYRLYRTADGWICIAAVGDAALARLADALGDVGLAAARAAGADVLAERLTAAFASLTSAEAFARLDGAGVACEIPAEAPVQPDYLWEDWALEAGRVFEQQTVPYGYVRELGLTVRLGSTPGVKKGPAPLLGEHSAEVLADIGWSPERIESLLAGPCLQYRAPAEA